MEGPRARTIATALETGLREFDHMSSDGDLELLRVDGSLEELLRRYQSQRNLFKSAACPIQIS